MSTQEQVQLCWSLCSAARQGVPSAFIMFRASLLYSETANPQVKKALALAFVPEQLQFHVGAAPS